MAHLTVGYVSGIIALGIAILSFLLPNLIALLLASIAKRERTAVTWSVIGRELHNSIWSSILDSDSTSSKVPLSVNLLGWLRILGVALITVAGVVTPLGLQSEVSLGSSTQPATFQHIVDAGPIGLGTPARDPRDFTSRLCDGGVTAGPCPFSDTQVAWRNTTDFFYNPWNGSYDIRIPYVTAEVFSSLRQDYPESVAGPWDILWRLYSFTQRDAINDNNTFQVGITRQLTSLILDNAIEAVDGLLVDTKTGGIALRNHTAPAGLQLGAEWEEDLLFVTPETACVDTNLTLDYEVTNIGSFVNSSSNDIVNISLTDHGGFVNIDRMQPPNASQDTQHNPDLWLRAYRGAWYNNLMTMLLFNATTPYTDDPTKSFQYLNSSLGQRWWLSARNVDAAAYNGIYLDPDYKGYIWSTGDWDNGTFQPEPDFDPESSDPRANYSNPFGVIPENFTAAGQFCSGANLEPLNTPNISNLAISCGLMFGAAERKDGGPRLVLEPGTQWKQPIYSCASAMKASIKTVRLRWNATTVTSGLSALTVVKISDKTYASASNQPQWVVENWGRRASGMTPLWGLASADMARKLRSNPNFDILQSAHLYIPGYGSGILPGGSTEADDNIAAPQAFFGALLTAYLSGSYSEIYRGTEQISLLARWQALSTDPASASSILNLIWTDIVANSVTSARSWLSTDTILAVTQPRNASQSANLGIERRDNPAPMLSTQVPVYLYENRITYRWLYAIPALLSLALFILISATSLLLALLGRLAGPQTLTIYLNHTSAGRLLAVIAGRGSSSSAHTLSVQGSEQSDGENSGLRRREREAKTRFDVGSEVSSVDAWSLRLKTKHWVKGAGKRMVDLDAVSGQGRGQVRARRGMYEAVPQ